MLFDICQGEIVTVIAGSRVWRWQSSERLQTCSGGGVEMSAPRPGVTSVNTAAGTVLAAHYVRQGFAWEQFGM